MKSFVNDLDNFEFDNKGLSYRNLKLFRQFYQTYPQIRQTLSAQLQQMGFEAHKIGQSVTDELHNIDMQIQPDKLVSRLSFSHFAEMIIEPWADKIHNPEGVK